jgi:hypothetical protein
MPHRNSARRVTGAARDDANRGRLVVGRAF